jgi:hypothetical protein
MTLLNWILTVDTVVIVCLVIHEIWVHYKLGK